MKLQIAAALVCMSLSAASTYQNEIAEWHTQREAALKAPDGWLTLVGLDWLHEGANSFGKADSNDIKLPDGPAKVGSFELAGGKVTLSMDGEARAIRPNSPNPVKVGRLSLLVIRRGDKIGIRVRDPESEYRLNFHGIESFPVNEAYRVTARWVAEPKKIPILNIIGQTEQGDCPGYAEFELQGHKLRLYPIIEVPGDKQLFYIFKDQTSGKETYGAGRFFYSDMPKDGQVVLDFNKAYNPPCAFTPYATCPLPPPENRLPVRVEAGEKKYGDH